MKDIGERLKETRESMEITLEEAAEDLKVELTQIQNLEEGNMENFKDVYYLKYLIRDYSKYLGLDKEKLINEFNEYLFDYTSKISLEDIKKAQEEVKEQEEDKIRSPYTIEPKQKSSFMPFLLYTFAIVILALVVYFVYAELNRENIKQDTVTIKYESR